MTLWRAPRTGYPKSSSRMISETADQQLNNRGIPGFRCRARQMSTGYERLNCLFFSLWLKKYVVSLCLALSRSSSRSSCLLFSLHASPVPLSLLLSFFRSLYLLSLSLPSLLLAASARRVPLLLRAALSSTSCHEHRREHRAVINTPPGA